MNEGGRTDWNGGLISTFQFTDFNEVIKLIDDSITRLK